MYGRQKAETPADFSFPPVWSTRAPAPTLDAGAANSPEKFDSLPASASSNGQKYFFDKKYF